MNNKISYILEIIWLLIAVACLVLGFYRTYKIGLGHSYMIFIISIIAFVMYSIRRYIRKSQRNK
jgi:4-hydroxybenzoate polyprenyltransferase